MQRFGRRDLRLFMFALSVRLTLRREGGSGLYDLSWSPASTDSNLLKGYGDQHLSRGVRIEDRRGEERNVWLSTVWLSRPGRHATR